VQFGLPASYKQLHMEGSGLEMLPSVVV